MTKENNTETDTKIEDFKIESIKWIDKDGSGYNIKLVFNDKLRELLKSSCVPNSKELKKEALLNKDYGYDRYPVKAVVQSANLLNGGSQGSIFFAKSIIDKGEIDIKTNKYEDISRIEGDVRQYFKPIVECLLQITDLENPKITKMILSGTPVVKEQPKGEEIFSTDGKSVMSPSGYNYQTVINARR